MNILASILMLFWSRVLDLQQVLYAFNIHWLSLLIFVGRWPHWCLKCCISPVLPWGFLPSHLSPPSSHSCPCCSPACPVLPLQAGTFCTPSQTCAAGFPLTSPLLLRRLRKELSGLKVPGGGREGKGSRLGDQRQEIMTFQKGLLPPEQQHQHQHILLASGWRVPLARKRPEALTAISFEAEIAGGA